jgi:dihydroxyacid dehydratase/phosphogluconate dehydratase
MFRLVGCDKTVAAAVMALARIDRPGLVLSGGPMLDGRANGRGGRFSGATRGLMAGHVSPEAARGGPIAAIRDGDMIAIDLDAGRLDVELSDDELDRRLVAHR